MLPLSMAQAGDQLMVVRIGGKDEKKKHLEDLGFVVGTPVQVVSAPGNGNVIVALKGARLAITSQMAAKIQVTEGEKQ